MQEIHDAFWRGIGAALLPLAEATPCQKADLLYKAAEYFTRCADDTMNEHLGVQA